MDEDLANIIRKALDEAKATGRDDTGQTGKPKDRIAASDMFQRCCEFCIKAGLPIPSSEKDLHSSLEALNFFTKKSNNVYWIGVEFRDQP